MKARTLGLLVVSCLGCVDLDEARLAALENTNQVMLPDAGAPAAAGDASPAAARPEPTVGSVAHVEGGDGDAEPEQPEPEETHGPVAGGGGCEALDGALEPIAIEEDQGLAASCGEAEEADAVYAFVAEHGERLRVDVEGGEGLALFEGAPLEIRRWSLSAPGEHCSFNPLLAGGRQFVCEEPVADHVAEQRCDDHGMDLVRSEPQLGYICALGELEGDDLQSAVEPDLSVGQLAVFEGDSTWLTSSVGFDNDVDVDDDAGLSLQRCEIDRDHGDLVVRLDLAEPLELSVETAGTAFEPVAMLFATTLEHAEALDCATPGAEQSELNLSVPAGLHHLVLSGRGDDGAYRFVVRDAATAAPALVACGSAGEVLAVDVVAGRPYHLAVAGGGAPRLQRCD